MKKILFLILICFTFSNAALAQEKEDVGDRAKKYRQNLVQHQDELLEFLLQVPFEQRQYIFPMLSENRTIPKKIKTHPDVLVWKGKRPTRIAKRFQNDPELLEYLPAQFYYFLAPEMWPDETPKSMEGNPNKLVTNFIKNASVEKGNFAPESLIQLKNGLELAYNSLNQKQKERLKNPSEIYLSQMLKFSSTQLAKDLKKQGYDSPQDFAQEADKIAAIYRQYKQGKTPSISPEQELVQSYFSFIPYVFKQSGFEVLLNTEAYSD